MKKLKLFLFTLFFSGLMLGVYGQQDTLNLIFSEHRAGDPFTCYHEITNMGTEIADLSNVTLANVSNQTFSIDENGQWRIAGIPGSNMQFRLSGMLAPGASWIVMNVSDRFAPGTQLPDHREELLPIADMVLHCVNPFGVTDTIIPEWEMWADSTGIAGNYMWNWGNNAYVIFNHLENGDSIMLDQVNVNLNDANVAIRTYSDVAGIPEATRYYTLVRKANITTGNMIWDNAKGASLEDSEWIPIPNNQTSRMSWTSIKNHGDFHIDATSATIDVDIDNATMNVPWGIYKGDSIIPHLTLGNGMAWQYHWNADLMDSTHSIIRTGDTLTLYAAGNELEQIDFEITVVDAASDQAEVFPLLYKVSGGAYWVNPNTQQIEWNDADRWVQPYYATVGQPVIDTIGSVPYAERVDSLFKYLEKAPLANWEIVWHDGTVRADLQHGDILKVTAEDGSTVKEYFIDVQDYALGDNVELGAITWPDKSEFLENWMGDTIPNFSSGKTVYTVLVPYGTKSVPALVAHPVDINAQLETLRAVSLTGSQEDRSTVFNVTSESDTLTQSYTVIFVLEKDPKKVQIYEGTPFISESATNQRSAMMYLEIANPGNVDMDLSEYLIVNSTLTNPGDALQALIQDPALTTDEIFQDRYMSYVPGFKYHDDTVTWRNEPGILSLDGNVDPVVKPGNVFVIASTWATRVQFYTDANLAVINKSWDEGVGQSVTDLGVDAFSTVPTLSRGANALYLFKIVNDSVLEGTKAVGDPNDYSLVDVLGDPVDDGSWIVAGREVGNNVHRGRMRTKPYIYTGARSLVESSERFGTHPDTSAWIVETYNNELPGQDNIPDLIGAHVMDPVTVYLSTVTSAPYLVSDGFEGVQTIQGNLTSTTVDGFFGNVDKADPMQMLSIHSGVDGSVKDAADPVVGTDTLVVVSADGERTTSYALTDQALDTDAVLTLVNDPSDYTIEISGETGAVTGVVYGSLLKDVVAAVQVPSLAVMSIIDGAGNLIPLQIMNNDSTKVDTQVGDGYYFEVVAQDGITIITYKLEPASLASDAFVISSIYAVDQEMSDIAGLVDGTSRDLFYKNIEVVKGATSKVLNKLGQERMDGQLAYDDVLQVTSEDGSTMKTYFITFLLESTPDANQAPEIMLAFSDSTFTEPGTIMLSATATDDNLPPPPSLTYLWEVSSGSAADVVIETADQLTTNVAFNAKGSYIVTLSVSDGALTSQADVRVKIGAVGVETLLTPALRIYPNPAKDKLTVELENMPANSSIVSIFSITGSAIYNEKLSTQSTEIDLSGFEPGLYFIKLTSGDRSFTQRVEIQK
ncbi:MAG: T9SS type A sorting domain-containing protein [Bacteroides sp.]|nr:T9SS type A sorting domain-containing protein [Bacteroides sp.]